MGKQLAAEMLSRLEKVALKIDATSASVGLTGVWQISYVPL